jgi:hypothetical protein
MDRSIRWAKVCLCVAVLHVLFAPLALRAQKEASAGLEREESVARLMAQVGPPSSLAVEEFKRAGADQVRPHLLTAQERAKVEAALTSLPELHRRVLEKKLHSLAFVDGIPGEGTGLTSPDAKTGRYDITLRASLLDETLSKFLTTKERRVFSPDGSQMTVSVTGAGVDALTYVLLHEATHVVDKSCGITAKPGNVFDAGIWVSDREMVPSLSNSMAAATYFRGKPLMAVGKAERVYDALALTPFVSLYATASAAEDLAELVAWHEVLLQHHGDLTIELQDAHGEVVRRWSPLTFAGVQGRFAAVDRLLSSSEVCRGVLS